MTAYHAMRKLAGARAKPVYHAVQEGSHGSKRTALCGTVPGSTWNDAGPALDRVNCPACRRVLELRESWARRKETSQ